MTKKKRTAWGRYSFIFFIDKIQSRYRDHMSLTISQWLTIVTLASTFSMSFRRSKELIRIEVFDTFGLKLFNFGEAILFVIFFSATLRRELFPLFSISFTFSVTSMTLTFSMFCWWLIMSLLVSWSARLIDSSWDKAESSSKKVGQSFFAQFWIHLHFA